MACVTLERASVRGGGGGLHRLVLWIHISARMEWLPITVSLCHRDCSYHQELTQAPISQHPLTPITANGLPDEAGGVIPALMINNIKMKTLSILQSFRYKELENILLYYGRETEALQIIQPLSSFYDQAQMHPRITRYKWMEPIEKTIHSRVMDSKHKLLFTLALSLLSSLSILTELKQLER